MKWDGGLGWGFVFCELAVKFLINFCKPASVGVIFVMVYLAMGLFVMLFVLILVVLIMMSPDDRRRG